VCARLERALARLESELKQLTRIPAESGHEANP
jgi:hypothetical protein